MKLTGFLGLDHKSGGIGYGKDFSPLIRNILGNNWLINFEDYH